MTLPPGRISPSHLPQTHLIGQDAIHPILLQSNHPIQPLQLILPHLHILPPTQRRGLHRQIRRLVLIGILPLLFLHLFRLLFSQASAWFTNDGFHATPGALIPHLLEGGRRRRDARRQSQPCPLLLDVAKVAEYIALLQQEFQPALRLGCAFCPHVGLALFDVPFLFILLHSGLLASIQHGLGDLDGSFGRFLLV